MIFTRIEEPVTDPDRIQQQLRLCFDVVRFLPNVLKTIAKNRHFYAIVQRYCRIGR